MQFKSNEMYSKYTKYVFCYPLVECYPWIILIDSSFLSSDRVLARHSSETEEKHRLLMDALAHMQAAVAEQEHVAQNALSLLPAHNEVQRTHKHKSEISDFLLKCLKLLSTS